MADGTGDADTFIPVTNAIESLNARYRRAVRARGHFPTDQAARIQPVNATLGGLSSSESS